MVAIDLVRAANADLVRASPFVAVFSGGTSGIGEYTVRELAKLFGGDGHELRVYIVGRNQAAAEVIIADCRRICPNGQFVFLGGDLSLLKEVDKVCSEITRLETTAARAQNRDPNINLLVCSQGLLSFGGRQETEEGLDKHLSLFYYSRMRFTVQLLPLLRASPGPSHVITVGNPKLENKIITEDLSLREPGNFGWLQNISHGIYMINLFMERLAVDNAGKVSFSHYFPGTVPSKSASRGSLPWWAELLWNWVIAPLTWFQSIAPVECAQRVLFMASARFPPRSIGEPRSQGAQDQGLEIANGADDVVGSGFYRVDQDGSALSQGKGRYRELREQKFGDQVWEHTMEAFSAIESGKPFQG